MPGNTQICRLFYVDEDQTSNEKIFKSAADHSGIKETSRILQQTDLARVELFGVYGDRSALKTYLQSIFPRSDDSMDHCFTDESPMPTIWTIYNDQKIVLALILSDEEILKSSEMCWSSTIVMQRFLQDICQNIIICPSKSFFDNFTSEHSFHGKPHSSRLFKQVESSSNDVGQAKRVEVNDWYHVKVSCGVGCFRVLNSAIGFYIFTMDDKVEEESHLVTKKFQQLKQSLEREIHLNLLKMDFVARICQQKYIPVSCDQYAKIAQSIENHSRSYTSTKKTIEKQINDLIDDLLKRKLKKKGSSPSKIELPKDATNQIAQNTIEWLMNPKLSSQTAQEYADDAVQTIHQNQTKKKSHAHTITDEEKTLFAGQLEELQKKNQFLTLKSQLINDICSILQSENNQFDVYFPLQQQSFSVLSNEVQETIQNLKIESNTVSRLAFSTIADRLQIGALSEIDRRILSDRMKFVACFTTYDGTANILVLRRPAISSNGILPSYVHSIFHLKNNNLRKVTDYTRDDICLTYACNSSKQTLLLYDIETGAVRTCVINTFGRSEKSSILQMENKEHKPNSIKSLALTVTQDLLILIDSLSNVYSMDLTRENNTSLDTLTKTNNGVHDEQNFRADDSNLYECVQTIGERSPIFFFQSKSCVDIIDRNYHQLQSIKLDQHSGLYKMQIFTDMVTTYCVLFDDMKCEAYAIQNLISDTRIERQQNLTDLGQSNKQNYVGNRLLDVIKRGEMQFGTPAHYEKTKYYFIFPNDQGIYFDRISRYFRELSLGADLVADDKFPSFYTPSRDPKQIGRIINSRVPVQLCAIEMGTLTPLNDGRREQMDHLSLKSFSIETKVREITFSYLDQVMNEIDESLPIIGIMGRQSTGKSYLMNRIFDTRFAVAAGRCTDGIWMSYAVCEDKHFVVLDCEGLFSDQRTEDEEMKLLAFLSAMCDVTILSQDLGFSRYQDRLFDLLSKSVERIGKNDELFQGTLLIMVRDIGDTNGDEALDAAETKFKDLQRSGRGNFLQQLFSKYFTIQPLHHFENTNFNQEIACLKKQFIKLSGKKRWNDGKELTDRMKILLVQLYTDDFLNSKEIHIQVKISELEETMKKIWTQFDKEDKTKQIIERVFEDETYRLEINHQDFQLDETTMKAAYEQLWSYLFEAIPDDNQTKEKKNRLLCFLDSLIPEILVYRRQKVKDVVTRLFEKAFPTVPKSMRDKRKKFFDEMDQYMNSFKLRMCLKKCFTCDLKCVQDAQHTEDLKAALDEAKHKLGQLKSLIEMEPTAAEIEGLDSEIQKAQERKNEISETKDRFEDERRYLEGKEEIENQISQNQLKIAELENTINDSQSELKRLEKKMEESKSTGNPMEDFDQIIHNEIQAMIDLQRDDYEGLRTLMKKLYAQDISINYETIQLDDSRKNDVNDFINYVDQNINKLREQWSSLGETITKIMTDMENSKSQFSGLQDKINEVEKSLNSVETENGKRRTDIDAMVNEKQNLSEQLEEKKNEYKNFDKKIQAEASENISDQDKIRHYIDNSKIKLSTDSLDSTDEIDEVKEAEKLLKDLESINQDILSKDDNIVKMNKLKKSTEKTIQECHEAGMDSTTQEQFLSATIGKIEEKQAESDELLQKKSSIYDENKLFKKILNEFLSEKGQEKQYEDLAREISTINDRLTQISENLTGLTSVYEQQQQHISNIHLDLDQKRNEKLTIEQEIKVYMEKHRAGENPGRK